MQSWTHPTANDNCPGVTLSVAYTAGTPVPASLPTGGTVTSGGAASETFAKGQTIVTYTATDGAGLQNSVSCSFTVTITARPTVLTYTGPTSADFGHSVTVTTTLLDQATSAPLWGKRSPLRSII